MNLQRFATVGNLIDTIDQHSSQILTLKRELLACADYTEIPQLVTKRWYCLGNSIYVLGKELSSEERVTFLQIMRFLNPCTSLLELRKLLVNSEETVIDCQRAIIFYPEDKTDLLRYLYKLIKLSEE